MIKKQFNKLRRTIKEKWNVALFQKDDLRLDAISNLMSIKRKILRAKRQLLKFKAYFPIILADEDWDHAFFWSLMEFKISRMRKFFSSEKTYGMNSKTVTTQLEYAEYLLKRINQSDIGDEENVYIKKFNAQKNTSMREWEFVSEMKAKDIKAFYELIIHHSDGWWD